MLVKTKAVVLRRLKYGDDKMVVDMLTRECGRMPFICRMAKTQRGQLKRQMFAPLSIVDIEIDQKLSVQMQHLRNISIATPLNRIAMSPEKTSVALFTAEFLTYATAGEQQRCHDIFDYVESSIKWLDSAEHHYANFHLVLMMRLSRFIGFFPNTEKERKNSFFDLRNSCFCDIRPSHNDFLTPEEAAHISTLLRMDFSNMHLFRLSRAERNRCCDIIIDYYRLHVAGFGEMRSTAVMREVFE